MSVISLLKYRGRDKLKKRDILCGKIDEAIKHLGEK